MAAPFWYRGVVKSVLSGDCLVIKDLWPNSITGIPSERVVTLSSIRAPKLAGKDRTFDEPFAWSSREHLRKLCLGREVLFCIDSVAQPFGFKGSVFLGYDNVAALVLREGLATVITSGSLYYYQLMFCMDEAFNAGRGLWSGVAGVAAASIRTLPPPLNADTTKTFLEDNKGKTKEAIVESVCENGTTIIANLLSEFQMVHLIVAGAQVPKEESNRIEARMFTESNVLNRDVWIKLEGVDKYSCLIGSVYYNDGDIEMNLGMELVENGYAKFESWSAEFTDEDAKQQLKKAEFEAKKKNMRIWKDYVIPVINSKPIRDEDFTGTVVEVVSGECVIVASEAGNRRVYLSSILCPRIGNLRRGDKPATYAYEAKEFTRERLIGQQVDVQMEYSKNVIGHADAELVKDYGSVFHKDENIGRLLVANGLANVIKHEEFEEKSRYYDVLLDAERIATVEGKGLHSSHKAPVAEITDLSHLTTETAEKARKFLPSLQRTKRISAIVEYVISGNRFKLYIPKETCSLTFTLSGVRCPILDEPYANEAVAVTRQRLMQRYVEIEVDTVAANGSFMGSMWERGTNVSIPLIEAGLAKYTFVGNDDIEDGECLEQAMKDAKTFRRGMWHDYYESAHYENKTPRARKASIKR